MFAEHVPLKVRKALLGRILIHGAFGPYRRSGSQPQLLRAAYVIDRMEAATRQAVVEADDQTPLDVFVLHLLDEAESDLCGRWKPVENEIAKARHYMRATSCCATCANPRQICSFGWHDDIVVRERGACIELLTKQFRLANDIALSYHIWACGPAIAAEWPNALFCTDFTYGSPHTYDSDIHVSARVRRGAETQVWLTYGIEKFDWRAYLATLYVLVHECFHYFEGLDGGVLNGEPDDPFVEGWMDRVAFRVTQEVAKGEGHLAQQKKNIPYVSHAQEFARDLHDARSKYALTGAAVWLSAGREAADRLLDIFEALATTPQEGWRMFVRLSILIHRQGWPKMRHLKLVNAINDIGDLISVATGDPSELPAIQKWYGAIRKSLELSDMHALIAFINTELA